MNEVDADLVISLHMAYESSRLGTNFCLPPIKTIVLSWNQL